MSDFTPLTNLVNQNAESMSSALAECQSQCYRLEEMVVAQNERISVLLGRVDSLTAQVILASTSVGSGPTA